MTAALGSEVSRAESDRRLNVLADFLEEVPDDKFDFRLWFGGMFNGLLGRRLTVATCDTAACALGWATAIPEFFEMGLQLMGHNSSAEVVLADADGYVMSNDSYDAGAMVFGLRLDEANYLFTPSDDAREDGEDDEDEDGENMGGIYGLPPAPSGRASGRQVARTIRRFIVARNVADPKPLAIPGQPLEQRVTFIENAEVHA